MVEAGRPDEWKVIEGMLPNRWRDTRRAVRRARYVTDPAQVLCLLFFHAVNDGGLRQKVTQALRLTSVQSTNMNHIGDLALSLYLP
jgi:hypothetical protein